MTTIAIAVCGSGWGVFDTAYQGDLDFDDQSWRYYEQVLPPGHPKGPESPPDESTRRSIAAFALEGQQSADGFVVHLVGKSCDWSVVIRDPIAEGWGTDNLRPIHGIAIRHYTGWPFRAYASEHHGKLDWISLLSDLQQEEDGYPPDRPTDWSLRTPTRVLWPGLIADIAIFGFTWLAFLLGITTTRRTLRRRRGRCPMCGYDLRSEMAMGCPECGWRRVQEGTGAARDQGIKGKDP